MNWLKAPARIENDKKRVLMWVDPRTLAMDLTYNDQPEYPTWKEVLNCVWTVILCYLKYIKEKYGRKNG